MSETTTELTPEPIFRTLTAYWASGALAAAIDLDLFTAVAAGARTPEAIAKATSADPRATRMLCDALCPLGFLAPAAGGGYACTPVSDVFLDRAKPGYFGAIRNIVTNPLMWGGYGKLTEAVKAGGSVMEKHALVPDHEFWTTFARSSLPMVMQQGGLLAAELDAAGLRRGASVLDIACGTGGYGFQAALRDPAARVTAVDWPTVLVETKEVARRLGVADRVAYVAGDAFEADLGRGHDVALLTNIFHHFDRAACVRLARRMREALAPDGHIAVVEFVPDDARKEAALPLLFGLTMLAWTPRGDVYTLADLRSILEEAGFTRVEARQPAGIAQTFVLARCA